MKLIDVKIREFLRFLLSSPDARATEAGAAFMQKVLMPGEVPAWGDDAVCNEAARRGFVRYEQTERPNVSRTVITDAGRKFVESA